MYFSISFCCKWQLLTKLYMYFLSPSIKRHVETILTSRTSFTNNLRYNSQSFLLCNILYCLLHTLHQASLFLWALCFQTAVIYVLLTVGDHISNNTKQVANLLLYICWYSVFCNMGCLITSNSLIYFSSDFVMNTLVMYVTHTLSDITMQFSFSGDWTGVDI